MGTVNHEISDIMKAVLFVLVCCALARAAPDVSTRMLQASCSAQQAEAKKICNEDPTLCETARSSMDGCLPATQLGRQLLGTNLASCNLRDLNGRLLTKEELFWTCIAAAQGVVEFSKVNATAVKKTRKYRAWKPGSNGLATTSEMTSGLQNSLCHKMSCDEMKAFLVAGTWGSNTVITKDALPMGIVFWPESGQGSPDDRVMLLQLEKVTDEFQDKQFRVTKECFMSERQHSGRRRRRRRSNIRDRASAVLPDYQCANVRAGPLGIELYEAATPTTSCPASAKGTRGPCSNGQKCWVFSGLDKDAAFKRSCTMH